MARKIHNKSNIEGNITINGRKSSDKILFRTSGFVPQEDILLGSMTTFELLMFHAEMKLPNMAKEDKVRLVDSLIKNLGLEAVKHSLIGYTGQFSRNSGISRGLSGGERKRVSICYELISNPKLLFLDEPTSGLDSFAAKVVVENLRSLAFTGRTVITTIHQPSAKMISLFDDICIMGEGKVVYFGRADRTLRYFTNIGFQPPSLTNPGEFFLNILRSEKELKIDDDVEMGTFSTTDGDNQIKRLVRKFAVSKEKEKLDRCIGRTKTLVRNESNMKATDQPGLGKQLKHLIGRSVTHVKREPMLLRMRFIQSLFLAILGGLIWLRSGNDQVAASDKVSAIFFMLNANLFGSITGPGRVFPPERAFHFRERQSYTYSTFLYYLSKNLVDIPLTLLAAFFSNTIVYFMIGFHDSPKPWILFIVFTMLINYAAHAAGMFIICSTFNARIATSVIQPLFLMPLMLFSGFFLNTNNVPKYFIWLEYTSFLKYGFRGAINSIFGMVDHVFTCEPDEVCRFVDGTSIQRFYFSYGHDIWLDMLIIVFIGTIFHVIAFSFLYFKGKKAT